MHGKAWASPPLFIAPVMLLVIALAFVGVLRGVKISEMMLDSKSMAAARTSLGLTQEQMAHLLGVSFASVNRWEAGHSSPTGPP